MTARDRMIMVSTTAALAIVVLAGLSCRKDRSEGAGDKAAAEPTTSEAAPAEPAADKPEGAGEFAESDEDLLAVDYTVFYDELAAYGKWIEVDLEELGLEAEKEALLRKRSIVDRIFGVREAFADVSVAASVGATFVWQPDASLAAGAGAEAEAGTAVAGGAEAGVAVAGTAEAGVATPGVAAEAGVAVEAEPGYTPYENGQWVSTDAGWYFHAETDAEEITSHYGRWTFTASLGWVWLPGAVWAGAWVDWREDETYVAWTPVPPRVYLTGAVLVVPPVWDIERYVVVEKRFFLEPAVYKYKYSVKQNPNKLMIKSMVKVDGVMIKNKAVYNMGPGVGGVEKASGKKTVMVKIHKVDHRGKVKFGAGEYSVFAPSMKKVKITAKGPVSKPKASVKFHEAKVSYKAKVTVKEKGGPGIKEHAVIKTGSGKGPKVEAGGKVGFGIQGGGKVSGGKTSIGITGGGKGAKPSGDGKGGKPQGGGKPKGGGKPSGGKPGGGKGKK